MYVYGHTYSKIMDQYGLLIGGEYCEVSYFVLIKRGLLSMLF